MPVHHHIVNFANPLHKGLFHLVQPLHFLVQVSIYHFNGPCKPRRCRNIFRPGADAVLLPAAENDWFYLYLFVYIQEAHPFWPMYFMPAYRQQIYLKPFGINPEFPIALDSIHMEQDPWVHSFNKRPRFRYRLQGAHFVICMHNGYQYGFPGNSPFQVLQADTALFIHRQVGHPKALFL